jgi:endonuclease/exonuclease/phosphatase family metal-dependent hydrolase
MTRNLFLGAELTPLLSALSVADIASLAGGVWRDIQASRFPERAEVLADEIVRMDPDVVALQEVSLYRTQTPGDWTSGAVPNATTVELDFLQLLLDATSRLGGSYQLAVIGQNADEELPATAIDGTTFDIRLTDRDAILVKDGVTFAPAPGGAFPTAFSLPIGGPGGATLVFKRGFVSADVTRGGKTVRVVDSHLEVGTLLGRIQEQQARELLAALAPMGGPMILAGDFNSPADGMGTTSYSLLTTTAGSPSPFRDTWLFRQVPDMTFGEFTCCLGIADADPASLPQERIDLILFRGGMLPVEVSLVGPRRTPSGLWGSDHLGVSAELQIP